MDIKENTETVNKFEIVTLSLAESFVDSNDSDSSLCSEYTTTPFIEESVELITADVPSVQEKAEEQSHAVPIDTHLYNTAEVNVNTSFECMKDAFEKGILESSSDEPQVFCSQPQEVKNRLIAEECCDTELILKNKVPNRNIAEERCITEEVLYAAITNSKIGQERTFTEVIQNDKITNHEIDEERSLTEVIQDDKVGNCEFAEERSITEIILDDRSCFEERLDVDSEETCFSGSANHHQDFEFRSADPVIINSEIYPSTEDEESVSNHSGVSLPKCKICSKVFDCLNDLTLHQSSVHLGKGLNDVCKISNESFNVESNLTTHVQKSHLKSLYNNNSRTCRIVCQPNVQEHFSSEERGHQTHSQSNYDEISAESSKARSSEKAKSKVSSDGSMKCVTCNKDFRNMVSFTYHQEVSHSKGKRYQCGMCSNSYISKSGFRNHLKWHLGLQIKCSHCNKVYTRQYSLNMHLKRVNNQKSYKCSLCSKSYATRAELKFHLATMHKQGTPQPCEICGKIYYNRNCLKQHIRTHSEKDRLNKMFPNGYKCIRCETTFRGPKHLQNHLSKENGCLGVQCISCRECGKSYTTCGALLTHFKKKHGEMLIGLPKRSMFKYIVKEESVLMCEYCGLVFRTRDYFQQHLNCHLYGEQKHACSQCHRKFTFKESLEEHVKQKHRA